MKRLLFTAMFVSVVAAAGGLAWASRHGRAQAIFTAECARCHVVGWGEEVAAKSPQVVDLTLTATQHNEAWIRTWLKRPYAVKEDTNCRTESLDPVQVDLIVGFLTQHSRPMSQKLVIPPPHRPAPPRHEKESGK